MTASPPDVTEALRRSNGRRHDDGPVRPPTARPRRVGYRARTLGAALVLALLAGVLVLTYVRSYKARVEASFGEVAVLVAAEDVPPGTAGSEVVERGLARWSQVTTRNVVDGAVREPGQLQDMVTSGPIYRGEQLTLRRFATRESTGIRGQLVGSMRAISVAGEAHQVLAGLVRDGDRVDVLVTTDETAAPPQGQPATPLVPCRLLRDVVVLDAPEEPKKQGVAGRGSVPVVLGLTDEQAQTLFVAAQKGSWALLLRPLGGASESAGSAERCPEGGS